MSAPKLSDSSAGVNVVLLHGIGDTCRLFKHLRPFLEQRGHVVHCLNLAPNDGRAGLDALAKQVADYVGRAIPGSGHFHLIGFSMGGLVARYYVQRMDEASRVRRLITISSPHRGTWTAYLLWNIGARQMRPGSAFLRDLERNREVLTRARFTSIWTPLDLMIVPANSSVVPEANVVRINVTHHAAMVRDPRVMHAVEKALRS